MSVKIILGAGGTEQIGWLSLPHQKLDITNGANWAALFRPASIDRMVAEHVWEHLTLEQGFLAAQYCWHYLKPGGVLRIAVPDGFHSDPKYIGWVAPGTGYNGSDHKVLYNYQLLAGLLEQAGFNVELREWFDQRRTLHMTQLTDERGYIRRSIQSFWASVLSLFLGMRYTSLIVDAVKPGY